MYKSLKNILKKFGNISAEMKHMILIKVHFVEGYEREILSMLASDKFTNEKFVLLTDKLVVKITKEWNENNINPQIQTKFNMIHLQNVTEYRLKIFELYKNKLLNEKKFEFEMEKLMQKSISDWMKTVLGGE